MRKLIITTLPPIAVEEKPEKLTLALSPELKTLLERFGQFFAESTGQMPTSFNAVLVGILADYVHHHGGFQRWLKSRSRNASVATLITDSAP